MTDKEYEIWWAENYWWAQYDINIIIFKDGLREVFKRKK